MKYYATTTSETGKPATKGGQKYLTTEYNINSREPLYRFKIEYNAERAINIITLETFFFGKWTVKYKDQIFENKEM